MKACQMAAQRRRLARASDCDLRVSAVPLKCLALLLAICSISTGDAMMSEQGLRRPQHRRNRLGERCLPLFAAPWAPDVSSSSCSEQGGVGHACSWIVSRPRRLRCIGLVQSGLRVFFRYACLCFVVQNGSQHRGVVARARVCYLHA